MRKFRNAALAVATATTVAISGVSVASAQDNGTPAVSGSSKAELEKKFGWNTQTNEDGTKNTNQFTGNDIAAWFKGDKEALPLWAKLFVGGGVAAAAASVLGLVVAPAYNFLKYNGFLG